MAFTVYLDLDGTILDVAERYYQVYCTLAHDLGQMALPRSMYWDLKRQRAGNSQVLCGWPALARAAFQERWLKLIESPAFLRYDRLIPGATEALRKLMPKYRLSLATLRTNLNALQEELSRFGLGMLFDRILAHPYRDPNDWIAKASLIAADRAIEDGPAVVVGDSEADVLAGKHMGLPTVAVLTGIRDTIFLEQLGPDMLIRDLTYLPGSLAQWEREGLVCRYRWST